MDIAICSISNPSSIQNMSVRAKSRTGKSSEEGILVEYAGANRPLIIIRKNEIKLEAIQADHFSIGGLQHDLTKSFTNHTHNLQEGDCIYIFTDGFADQFGGPKGKKFRIKNLKELLLTISQIKMSEQEEILSKTLNEWKSKVEQIDDVLIIGVRV